MVRYGATILHADTVTHQIIHVQDQVEKCRFQVRWRDTIGHSKFGKLAQQHFKSDHSLCKIRSIKRIYAVGADYAPLNLNSAHVYISNGLAAEETCAFDSFARNIEEVERKERLP